MLVGTCSPCCAEKWVCQCDCHLSGDQVAYPFSASVEITQAPMFTNPSDPTKKRTLNKTYQLTSPAGEYRGNFETESLLAFTDADGSVCCRWNNQIGTTGYGINDPGTAVEIKGNKLFVVFSFAYLPAGAGPMGPWRTAVARYTSANLLLNESLCRRQTADGQTEVTAAAEASVVYEGPPPASQPTFTFSWRVLLPQ